MITPIIAIKHIDNKGLYANHAIAIVSSDKINATNASINEDINSAVSDKNGIILAIVIIGLIKSFSPKNIKRKPTNLYSNVNNIFVCLYL